MDLDDITFEYADMDDVDFSGASLKDADLYGASLQDAIFNKRTNLDEADLRKADLEDAEDLDEARKLSGVQWGDTTCPDGSNSDDYPEVTCEYHS
jgi:uncharacterized protein YjbI with pentapeptide repeats